MSVCSDLKNMGLVAHNISRLPHILQMATSGTDEKKISHAIEQTKKKRAIMICYGVTLHRGIMLESAAPTTYELEKLHYSDASIIIITDEPIAEVWSRYRKIIEVTVKLNLSIHKKWDNEDTTLKVRYFAINPVPLNQSVEFGLSFMVHMWTPFKFTSDTPHGTMVVVSTTSSAQYTSLTLTIPDTTSNADLEKLSVDVSKKIDEYRMAVINLDNRDKKRVGIFDYICFNRQE